MGTEETGVRTACRGSPDHGLAVVASLRGPVASSLHWFSPRVDEERYVPRPATTLLANNPFPPHTGIPLDGCKDFHVSILLDRQCGLVRPRIVPKSFSCRRKCRANGMFASIT